MIYARGTEFQDQFTRMYPEYTQNLIEDENGKHDMCTKNITFVTTESCNLACTYCYECRKTTRHMSKDVAKKAIDCIFDKERTKGYINDNNKAVIIEFIGGEPFVNIEVMEFVMDYFLYKAMELNHIWAKNYMISVTTNGTLFEKPRVKKWIEKWKNRLSLSITIDGNKELHDSCRVFHDGSGSYDTVRKAVDWAIQAFGMSGTKVTFAPENIPFINTAIPHLFDIGLYEINANCVYENVWKDEHVNPFYNELLKLADWMIDNDIYQKGYISIFEETIGHAMLPSENNNWCGGDGQMLAISVDGKFSPCIRYLKYAMSKHTENEEIIVGDVDKGLNDKKTDPWLIRLGNITRKSQSTEECFNCNVASGCSW